MLRFTSTAAKSVSDDVHLLTISDTLDRISKDDLSIPSTVQRLFAYFDIPAEERTYLLSQVQQWAVSQGHASVLVELSKLSIKEPAEDPIAGIPMVNPVKKQSISMPVSLFFHKPLYGFVNVSNSL